MFIELIFVLVAFIGNLILGFFTLYKNPKSTTNKLFFLFASSLAIYIIFNYLALHQTNDEATLFWIRMVMLIALVINLFFFLLTTTFPHTKLQLRRSLFWVITVATLILIPLTQTNLIFKAVVPSTTQPIAGSGMPLFLLHTIILLGGGFIVLLNKFRKAVGVEKTQIKLFLLGAAFMFIAITVTILLFVLIINTTMFVPLLPLYMLVFVGSISYAIIKHRFLDIRLVVARTVSFALFIAYIGLVYSLVFTFLLALLPGITIDIRTLSIATILTFITAITFQPIRHFLEKITDNIFYKHRYNTSKLLYDLALIMASTLHLEHLTHRLLKELLSQMRVSRGAFILMEEDKIYEVAHEGYATVPEFDEKEIKALVEYHEMLIFEELLENQYKQILRKLQATVVAYLSTEGRNIGLLLLGEKLSGDIYTSEDIRLIKIFAPEAAVAIQNAQSFEEIHRFSITLQEEVNRATKELLIANKRLESLDKLKDEFLSLASHELRTPMVAVKSYLWMVLQERVGQLSEKQKKYLDIAYKSTDRLIALVNDMLNISRIESGKLTPDLKPTRLNQLIDDVVVEMTPVTTELGIEIAQNLSSSLPQVLADYDKIKEVLINLLSNSLKFTPREGKITITLRQKDGFIETSISDTGVGIKMEDLPKLFQKFGMLGGQRTIREDKKVESTGLGLYLCKLIVELHGGKIWAMSKGEGKGATFTFSLKVAD